MRQIILRGASFSSSRHKVDRLASRLPGQSVRSSSSSVMDDNKVDEGTRKKFELVEEKNRDICWKLNNLQIENKNLERKLNDLDLRLLRAENKLYQINSSNYYSSKN